MRLYDGVKEVEFQAQINACFPYNDPVRSVALIEEAFGISLNAACCVLNEICRPPDRGRVPSDRQGALLAEWASDFQHELKDSLLTCAAALITDQPLDWRMAVKIMDYVGTFDGQRAALFVTYSAGDCDSAEGNAGLEAAYKRITTRWEKRGV